MKNKEFLEIKMDNACSGISVEDVLRDKVQVPRKMLHNWRMASSVLLNNESANWMTKIMSGDVISIPIYIKEENDVVPFGMQIEVTYEDDDILIVNKPVKLNIHPDSESDTKTLSNAVSNYFIKNNIQAKPRHINRLDCDTSGLVLFAKNAFIGAKLDLLLAERKINRTYFALVNGKVSRSAFTINEPISRDRHSNLMRVSKNGQNAITHVTVIKANATESLIECNLETGRTHQIRVHLSHIGHPLVGDTSYGGKASKHTTGQALHAYKIKLVHPITNKEIEVETTIPFSI